MIYLHRIYLFKEESMNRDVHQSTFGNELMMLYGRAKLSQSKFASLVGISSVALRKWESGESCPKAESLKRVVEILMHQGAFWQGEEQREAMHLWELANQRGLKVPFDEVWFREIRTVGVVPCADPVRDPNPVLSHDPMPGTDPPAKTRGRRKRLLALLIALVILAIIGSAGTLFFYIRGHATDQTYPGYLPGKGTLVFFDSLSQKHGNEWSVYSHGTSCLFTGGSYHVSQRQPSAFTSCHFNGGVFSNFAFEVQLTVVQGGCGGIVFREDGNSNYYYFEICRNGAYMVTKSVHNADVGTKILSFATSSLFHAELGQQNKIAVVASNSIMNFYINEQQIPVIQDNSYTSGRISLTASCQVDGTATDVAYRNARLWTW
jgi:transcriptional regulator with XRE-family HTH domain